MIGWTLTLKPIILYNIFRVDTVSDKLRSVITFHMKENKSHVMPLWTKQSLESPRTFPSLGSLRKYSWNTNNTGNIHRSRDHMTKLISSTVILFHCKLKWFNHLCATECGCVLTGKPGKPGGPPSP